MRRFAAVSILVLAGCQGGTPPPENAPPRPTAATAAATAPEPAPYDAQFIDRMIPHHEMAVTMAKEALEKAERAELRQLAQAIIDAQEAEIRQMRDWRAAWYPSLPPTGAGASAPMAAMGGESASSAGSFDRRFIDEMIPHHETAVTMATEAQERASHEELRQAAAKMTQSQSDEIRRLREWRKGWFGE